MDNLISLDLHLDRDVLFELMFLAHSEDITLNELVNKILLVYVDSQK